MDQRFRLDSSINMDYRCPFCYIRRYSHDNRRQRGVPAPRPMARYLRKRINELKTIIHKTYDLELYLDCLKYLYDIRLKEYNEINHEWSAEGVAELTDEIVNLTTAVTHAEAQKENWSRNRRRWRDTHLDDIDFKQLGRRTNLTLYRYDDHMDELVGPHSIPTFEEELATLSSDSDTSPDTIAEAASIAIPQLALPRSASIEPSRIEWPDTYGSTRIQWQENSRPKKRNSDDSKQDPQDVDMRQPRRGTRHGTTIRAARTNRGGKRKRRRKTKKKARRRRTKNSLFKKKRTKTRRKRKTKRRKNK